MEEKENPCVTDGMLDIVSYDVLGKLPDPFRFDDGRRVAGQADWAARRRELYKTAVELQYGVMPPGERMARSGTAVYKPVHESVPDKSGSARASGIVPHETAAAAERRKSAGHRGRGFVLQLCDGPRLAGRRAR